MISSVLSVLIGILVVFPFFMSLCMYIYARWKGRPFSVRKSADYTTPFLFLSVYIIAHTLFGDGVGYILLVATIIIMIGLAIYEKIRRKDFQIGVLLRRAWRLYFIILVFSYIVLIVIGLVWTIIDAVH